MSGRATPLLVKDFIVTFTQKIDRASPSASTLPGILGGPTLRSRDDARGDACPCTAKGKTP